MGTALNLTPGRGVNGREKILPPIAVQPSDPRPTWCHLCKAPSGYTVTLTAMSRYGVYHVCTVQWCDICATTDDARDN